MNALLVDPNNIIPLHEIRDEAQVEALSEDMLENGWQGLPLLVVDRGNEMQALTGTHRLAAAVEAGKPAHIHLINEPDLGEDESSDAWEDLLEARDDEHRLIAIEALLEAGEVDSDAWEIMAAEANK